MMHPFDRKKENKRMRVLFWLSQFVYPFLLLLNYGCAAESCRLEEKTALLQFKTSTSVDNFASYGCIQPLPKTDSWRDGTDCCLWEGITCDLVSGTVIGLDLSCSLLTGTLSPNSTLFHLRQLQRLDLSHNNFTGSAVSSVRNLTQLTYLDLSSNRFGGEILPDVFHNLTNLVTLSMGRNKFTGTLPSSIFNLTKLVSLDMSWNQFKGHIPYRINNLSTLKDLDLSDNSFDGTIPSITLPLLDSISLNNNNFGGQIPEFQTESLGVFDVRNNKLEGEVPSFIYQLVYLRYLRLSSNNLSGSFGFHMLSKLKNLGVLDLSKSGLTISDAQEDLVTTMPKLIILDLSWCKLKKIPEFIRPLNMSLVELYLSNNEIRGPVPEWMLEFGIRSLIHLDMSHNMLTGSIRIPWQNLAYLHLQSNFFEGPMPVPPYRILYYLIANNSFTGEISTLFCDYNYMVLDVSSNNLTGVIPNCLVTSKMYRSVLNVANNNFLGSIPLTFEKDCPFVSLNFNGNNLQGSLPKSILNCKNLQLLDIGNNNIVDTFPSWLDTLLDLQVIILRENQFHSSIKVSGTKHPFPKVRILDLSNNAFDGSLPSLYISNLTGMTSVYDLESDPLGNYMQLRNSITYNLPMTITMKGYETKFGNIYKVLTGLDLSNNKFDGGIPESIGDLIALKGLNLSHNSFSGRIPTSLGNLASLEWLDMSSNEFSGKIPDELLRLTSLAILNLSNNKLVGPIPRGKQFNSFENSSYVGNVGLCGLPLSKSCKEQPEQPTQLDEDEFEIFGFGWKSVVIGYGSGTVFGIALGHVLFRNWKPKCLAKLIKGFW